MIIAMVNIVHTKNEMHEPNLTTMHSWLGVVALSFFCVNFLWGSFMVR